MHACHLRDGEAHRRGDGLDSSSHAVDEETAYLGHLERRLHLDHGGGSRGDGIDGGGRGGGGGDRGGGGGGGGGGGESRGRFWRVGDGWGALACGVFRSGWCDSSLCGSAGRSFGIALSTSEHIEC